jgi:hypothetical protein
MVLIQTAALLVVLKRRRKRGRPGKERKRWMKGSVKKSQTFLRKGSGELEVAMLSGTLLLCAVLLFCQHCYYVACLHCIDVIR